MTLQYIRTEEKRQKYEREKVKLNSGKYPKIKPKEVKTIG